MTRRTAQAAGKGPRHGRRGAVLVVVLVTLMALAGLMMRDSGVAMREATMARSLLAEYQADMVAESALYLAMARLALDTKTNYDVPDDDWAKSVDGGQFTLTITPCNARLNVNRLPELTLIEDALRTLVQDRGDDEALVDYLVDWVDVDGQSRLPGSEDGEYATRWPRYSPRNAPMPAPEEILLVAGWEHYDPAWISQNLTVWDDKNLNLNFVSKEVFKAYLPQFEQYWQEIVSWRSKSGFRNKESDITSAIPALRDDPDALKEMMDAVSVKSDYFRAVIEVRLPFVYEKRRCILKRNPILPGRPPQLIRTDVLEIRPEGRM